MFDAIESVIDHTDQWDDDFPKEYLKDARAELGALRILWERLQPFREQVHNFTDKDIKSIRESVMAIHILHSKES